MGEVIITGEVRKDAPQMPKYMAVRIAQRIARRLGVEYRHLPYSRRNTPESWAYEGPRVWPGTHEESQSRYIISCEGFADTGWAWSDWLGEIVEEETGGAFYAEAGNSWYVGFYSTV